MIPAPGRRKGAHVDPATPTDVQPVGADGSWALTLSEEFNGTLDVVDPQGGYLKFRPDGPLWRDRYPDYMRTQHQQNPHTGNPQIPEWQYYDHSAASLAGGALIQTATLDNAHYSGNAKHDSNASRFRYTSSCINAHPSHNQTFGWFEARMKLPGGTCQWPAFWLFPEHWDVTPEGVATHWEIDVMECFASSSSIQATLHAPGRTVAGVSRSVGVTAFHTYGMAWEPDRIRWFVDGVNFATESNRDAIPRRPMYPILNLATRPSATWPATMVQQVDYVRVWQRADLPR